MIKPAFVFSIALLSLANNTGEFFDWIDVGQRCRWLDEV
jgi:hypothetical protein